MSIADNAFGKCHRLLYVKLATATSMGNCCMGLPKLTKVILPNATDLAANCVDDCFSLTSLVVKSTMLAHKINDAITDTTGMNGGHPNPGVTVESTSGVSMGFGTYNQYDENGYNVRGYGTDGVLGPDGVDDGYDFNGISPRGWLKDAVPSFNYATKDISGIAGVTDIYGFTEEGIWGQNNTTLNQYGQDVEQVWASHNNNDYDQG